MVWSPRCQSSGELYGTCQDHPEWPKQETVPKAREAVRYFLCAAVCRKSRRLMVTARGGMAAWQASICSKSVSQLNTAVISSWDVSYPCCWNLAAFWFSGRTWEESMTMGYKHRHFMLRFSSENPFRVFFLLVWDEVGFQHFPLVKLSHLCKCSRTYHLKFKSYSIH